MYVDEEVAGDGGAGMGEGREDLQRFLRSHGLMQSSMPGKGRGLVTTRDFCPGDVIITQNPYVWTTSSALYCDGCFVSGNLKRCSSCQIAWYCGSTCQKSEWKLHKLECQALTGLSEKRRKMLTPTLRLMVRLLLKKKLQIEKMIPYTAEDNYDLVKSMVSHISDLDQKRLVSYAQMANLINLIIPEETDVKEVTENFSRLACNAHTMCDSELRPLGTGIYPVISIINHSCLPNSVLIFEGQRAVVRAVEHIPRGTEVFISYIETATSTMERKKALMEQYFFDCTCPCCNGVNACRDKDLDIILQSYQCKDQKCEGFMFHDSEKKNFRCQSCGLSQDQTGLEKLNNELKQMSGRASKCLHDGKYAEAGALYKSVEQNQSKLHHPLSVHLMKTREDIMKVFIELKDWDGALTYCRLTIPAYETAYPAIHPMLGLQYYTCGKLEWLLGQTNEALKSFTKAVDVLRITHGTTTPFMKELLNKLEEARLEAAWNRRLTD